MMSELSRRWLLLASAAIHLYLLGAACLLWAVAYPQLAEVARSELPAFHAALSRRLATAFILPEFLSFFSLLPLLWRRPEAVPAWPVWAAVGLGLVYFALTFGWHLPQHRLLAGGDASPGVMGALMASHAVRTVTVALRCGLLLWAVSIRSEPR
jgi:hypothetical protein